MAWKKVSQELSDFLEETLQPFHCEKRKMFGCPAYFVKTNMFASVFEDQIIIRLSEQDREAIFAEFDEAAVFDPVGGRPLKEYVSAPDSLYNNSEQFSIWLNRAYEYTRSLPPKKTKRMKK